MRPRPCSPGGYERRSIAHFSVRQRSPFRKSLSPSRRHWRHFAPVSRATSRASASWAARRSALKRASHFPARKSGKEPKTSTPPPLLGPHAVVGLRGDVLDAEDLEPGRLERADRRLAARARALDEDLDLLEAVLHALAGGVVGGHLRGERSRLARALEPRRAGGLPGDHVPLLVGQGDDRVVERRLDVRLADRDVLADATARAAARGGLARGSHYFAFFPRPTVFFGPLRVRALVFVRWPCTGRFRRCRTPR